MTSLPTEFVFGTPSSVRDAIASYRRSQYFKVGSTVPSSSDISVASSYDEEAPEIDYDSQEDDEAPTPRALEWDPPRLSPPIKPPLRTAPREDTPLLRKAISFSSVPHPRRASTSDQIPDSSEQSNVPPRAPLVRRSSAGSSKSIRYNYGGQSTFGQTLFNSIAILLGIGMLSEPLAFAYAGWVGGTILIIFYGFITCYSAKLLAHMILADPRLRSYADIGTKAFGPRAAPLTSAMFFLELFSLSVVLVTLYADSLHTIVPTYSANMYKIWGLVVLIPTVFFPLSLLSYASILGIISTVLMMVVIFIDGFSKAESPGSLWSPAETSFGVENLSKLGVAFGLFMAGFSGHAVIPSLARDMVNPTEFDYMINWAFGIATLIYGMIGSAGYLMFGNDVSDEVSRDLLNTPGFNPLWNQIALWLLVVSPLSKFALATRPLNITLEIMLGLDPSTLSTEEPSAKSPLQIIQEHSVPTPRFNIKKILIVIERIIFTILSVTVSILIPEFSSLMAFLGSFSAFILCVIYPVSSKISLSGKCTLFDAFLLVVAIIMAAWGTAVAFTST